VTACSAMYLNVAASYQLPRYNRNQKSYLVQTNMKIKPLKSTYIAIIAYQKHRLQTDTP